MTRKEELKQRAITIVDEFPICFETETEKKEYQEYVFDMLRKVEREVWQRVAEHCHGMHNDGYTLNDVLGCSNEGDVITGASNDELIGHDIEQRREIEQQAKRLQELEEWQKIVTGTGTDQEAVVRMAATEYTKVAVQCWKEKCEQQAQQIATLREALQLLYDVQNGCPLPTYQKDWDRAMELTQQALKEVKE